MKIEIILQTRVTIYLGFSCTLILFLVLQSLHRWILKYEQMSVIPPPFPQIILFSTLFLVELQFLAGPHSSVHVYGFASLTSVMLLLVALSFTTVHLESRLPLKAALLPAAARKSGWDGIDC